MNHIENIKKIIALVSVISANEINTNDSLASIGIDSLKMVELIVTIEDELNIKFDDSELNPMQLSTVESIIALSNKYLNIEET